MDNLVFLVGTARSGTSYLGYKFATHPQVRYKGEFLFPEFFAGGFYEFYRGRARSDDKYLLPEGAKSAYFEYFAAISEENPDKKIILDLKIEQFSLDPMAEGPVCRSSWKFLLLTRLNYLKQAISEVIMYRRIANGDTVVHRDYVPEKIAVRVEPDAIINRMRMRQKLVEKYYGILRASGRPCLDLCYEELVGGQASVWDGKMLEFLEIEQREMQSKIVKQNVAPLEELVENHDALIGAVRQSEFAYTLHMPQ